MENNKQRQRDRAMILVTHFKNEAQEWEHVRKLIDLDDPIEVKRATNSLNLAMGQLLTFMDELIDGFGYSKGVQAAIDGWNERSKTNEIEPLWKQKAKQ